MDRVRFKSEAMPLVEINRPQSTGAEQSARPSFTQQLVEKQREQANKQLDDMVQRITELGDRVGRTLNKEDLGGYKQAIRDFFQEALAVGSQVTTHMDWNSSAWEHKTLATISRVDNALNDLADLIHTQEQDRLRVVTAIETVKGLLLDIRI